MRFLAENLVEALSPSNVPLLNPASAKAAIDTGGLSLVRGARNLLRDMASPPRIPQMVDGVGVHAWAGTSRPPRGAVVLRTEVFELIQYAAADADGSARCRCCLCRRRSTSTTPLDLAPGRSWIEHLVRSGQQVFIALLAQSRRAACRPGAWTPTCKPCWTRWTRSHASAGPSAPLWPGSVPAASSPAWRPRTWPARVGRPARRSRPRGHRARPTPSGRAGGPGRPTSRGRGDRPVAAARISRRPGVGRDLRLAAPRRPGVELLGQQLPARPAAARVRRSVLERRHHADDRASCMPTSSTLRCTIGSPTPAARPCSAVRSTSPRSTSTPTWSLASPTTSRPGRAATAPPQLFGGDTRFVLSTSGHIAALVNPPDNPKATLPGRAPQIRPTGRSGCAAPSPNRAVGGPTSVAWLDQRCGT